MSNPTNPNHPANPDVTTGYTAADMLPGGCEACGGTGETHSAYLGHWLVCADCSGTSDPS